MGIAETLIGEMQFELQLTRKVLERLPVEHYGWKPHAKSMSAGELASHLADNMDWAAHIATTEELNFDPSTFVQWVAKDSAELLAKLDSSFAAASEALKNMSDDDLKKTWRMSVAGNVIFEQPKGDVIDGMVIKHTIHHRGQMTVYLRLLDVLVPSTYGPSADENIM